MQVKWSVFEISGSFLIFKVRYKALLKKKQTQIHGGDSSPKNENSVINYSPSCRPKHARPLFVFRTHITIFFLLNPRALRPCIDSKGPITFKVQKGTKNIDKIVHVTSVVQPSFYEAREYFVCKQIKIPLFKIYSPPF